MSLLILEASLQPRPFVVTPIWRGPSVWVERRVNVQRFGASTTLIGMRFFLQSVEMCLPVLVSTHFSFHFSHLMR